MILFPAIDILDGRAVRLYKGLKSQVTDYGTPSDRAEEWISGGAKWLHVVDLSGAFDGARSADKAIAGIVKLGVPVQSGGGLRTLDDISRRLDLGVARVIVGTMMFASPDEFERAVSRYGDKIVAGIDAKDGYLAIKGWTETTELSAVELGKRCKDLGITTSVFTDISKDGALTGVNVGATAELAARTGLNVIASGGVSTVEDLIKLRKKNTYGAILGKAIYSGAFTLKEAYEAVNNAL